MSFHGRSLDDMPLAAYSTGVAAGDDEPEPLNDPGYTSVPAPSASTADMVAHAHAHPEATPESAPASRRGLRLPFRMPSFGRGRQAALEAHAPFQAVAAGGAPALPFESVSAAAAAQSRPFEPVSAAAAPARSFDPGHQRAFETVHVPVSDGSAPPRRRLPGLQLPGLQLPKLDRRDPRVLAGGAVAIGLVLLVVSLLGGGGAGSGLGPNASQGNTGAQATPEPANASVEMTGGATGLFSLNGATGSGPAVDSRVDATWTDVTGQSLLISGLASQGTRTTDANFVLSWTMLIDGAAVTFTSRASECTIGMAVGPKAVHGTFVCKKLESADGKHVIDLRGTYQT